MSRAVAFVQGGYYVLTGLWPLISKTTYPGLTEAASDQWMVRLTASLTATIGLSLIVSGWTREVGRSTVFTGMLAGHMYMLLDLGYPTRAWFLNGWDMPINALFLTGWMAAKILERRASRAAKSE